MSQIFNLLEQLYANDINELKNSISTQNKLVKKILTLSDFFIQNPEGFTPWENKNLLDAYLFYFLPLNYIRNSGVFERGQQVQFFSDITTVVDWGCGPATASLALYNQKLRNTNLQFAEFYLIDRHPQLEQIFKPLYESISQSQFSIQWEQLFKKINPQKSLLVCSYSLTENNTLPAGFEKFEALMILEPSTQEDGRHIETFRQQLIQAGYTIWAPCLHQKACPLITHSKTDWCHDRFHVEAPDWFKQLEKELPMKNKTVTTSYLLARKKSRPTQETSFTARIVGDSLLEKGKTRQLICRSEQREFLAWMHKEFKTTSLPEPLPRGEIVQIPEESEIKSNEIRVKSALKIF